MRFYFIFPLLFFRQLFIFAQNCIGYNSISNLCQECPRGSYMTQALSTPDYFAPNGSTCSVKNPLNQIYNMTYFVSNVVCTTSCLGTKDSPFDSVLKALKQIHNTDLAEKFLSQNIQIYLLGNPHYMLYGDINQTNLRFFRRMNANILIAPWFCEDGHISGCFSASNGERANLIIKTFAFYFEIQNSFTIKSVNLTGNDIVLNNATSQSCYQARTICCTETLLNKTKAQTECGLRGQTISLSGKKSMTQIKGFFKINPLFDDNFTAQANLNITPTPVLNLINCSVSFFYSVNVSLGWLSFIIFGTFGYNINMIDVNFLKCFFAYGLMYFSVLEEDPYFAYIPSVSRNLYYNKYPFSNLYNSTIASNGFIIDTYNIYSFLITTGFQGSVLNAINLFSDYNNNSVYSFSNLIIMNSIMTQPLYFFSFVNSWTVNPWFIFQNVSFYNNTLLLFLKISSCNVAISNLSFQLTANTLNNSMINLMTSRSGSLCITSSQFINTNLFSPFLLSTGFNITFLNSVFSNFNNTSFSITNGSLLFQTVQFLNCSNSIIFISASTANLNIQNSSFYIFQLPTKSVNFIQATSCFMNFIGNQLSNFSTGSTNSLLKGLVSSSLFFSNNTFLHCTNTLINLVQGSVLMNDNNFFDSTFGGYFLTAATFNISINNLIAIQSKNFGFSLNNVNLTLNNSLFYKYSNTNAKNYFMRAKGSQNFVFVLNSVFNSSVDMDYYLTNTQTYIANNLFLNYIADCCVFLQNENDPAIITNNRFINFKIIYQKFFYGISSQFGFQSNIYTNITINYSSIVEFSTSNITFDNETMINIMSINWNSLFYQEDTENILYVSNLIIKNYELEMWNSMDEFQVVFGGDGIGIKEIQIENVSISNFNGLSFINYEATLEIVRLQNITIINSFNLQDFFFYVASTNRINTNALVSNISISNLQWSSGNDIYDTIAFGMFDVIQISSISIRNITYLIFIENIQALLLFDCSYVSIDSCNIESVQDPAFAELVLYSGIRNVYISFTNNFLFANAIAEIGFKITDVRYAILENNTYINFRNGANLVGIGFSASSNKINNTFLVRNNTFMGIIGGKYGALEIEDIDKVVISNLIFFNVTTVNGAAMYLSQIVNIQIENITVTSASAQNGGILAFLNSIDSYLNLTNIIAFNVTVDIDGGAFLLENFINVTMQNCILNNISSGRNGGVFSLKNVKYCSISQITIETTCAKSGGVFVLDTGNFTISSITVKNSFAKSSGGVFYITNTDSTFSLSNSTLVKCFSGVNGGVLFADSVLNIYMINVEIRESGVDYENGDGVIYLKGYYVLGAGERVISRESYLINVHFISNLGKSACIHYSSNYRFVIQDSIAVNVTGSSFYFESDSNGVIEISHFTLENSNFFIVQNSFSSIIINYALMKFVSCQVFIANFIADNNANFDNLFEFISSFIEIQNSSLANFYNLDNSSDWYFLSYSKVIIGSLMKNVEIFNISYSPLKNMGFLMLDTSSVDILDCNFHDSLTNLQVLFKFQNSDVILVKNCLFQVLAAQNSIISSTASNVSFINSSFLSTSSTTVIPNDKKTVNIYFSDAALGFNRLDIESCVFENHDTGNSIYISQAFNVTILRSTFKFIKNTDGKSRLLQQSPKIHGFFSRALLLEAITSFFSSNCNIIGFLSSIGGAIAIYNTDSSTISQALFSNCLFSHNAANLGGVFYLEGLVNLSIVSSNFSNNIAVVDTDIPDSGKGGVLVTNCEDYVNCSVWFSGSSFINNSAESFGPTFLLKNLQNLTVNLNNSFINNTDALNFTEKFANFPLLLHLLSGEFSLNNFKTLKNISSNFLIDVYGTENLTIASGQPFNFTVMLTDSWNQRLVFDSEAQGVLSCAYYNTSLKLSQSPLIEMNKAICKNGFLSFIGVSITWLPDVQLDCKMVVTYDDSVFLTSAMNSQTSYSPNRTLSILFQINIRNCTRGELIMDDDTCFVCGILTYSVKDPILSSGKDRLRCLPCPPEAECIGGNTIFPKAGSWRFSKYSSLVLACPTPESCLGSSYFSGHNFDLASEAVVQGLCEWNYWGNLCYMCQKGFGRFKEFDVCEKCTQQFWPYFKIAIGIVFIICYIYIQAKVYATLRTENPNLAILLKMFLNHFQIIGMVSLVDLGWTIEFQSFFSFQDYFSCLYQNFFNIDCLIQEINQDLLAEKIIFTILLPVLLSLMMLLVWMINFLVALKRENEKNKKLSTFLSRKMRITVLAIIFILYPEIVRKCFMLINCVMLDDSNNFRVLKYSPNVICWGNDHLLWAFAVAFPGLLLWGILAPLMILMSLLRYKDQIIQKIKEMPNENTENEVLQKKTAIHIDTWMQERLFKNKTMPLTHTATYKVMNKTISETVEVNVLTAKEPLTASTPLEHLVSATNREKTTLLSEISRKEENDENHLYRDQEFYIRDKATLFDYLHFFEDLDKDNIGENDLENKYIYVKITFQVGKQEAKKKKRQSIFQEGKKESPTKKNTELKEEKSFAFVNLGFIYKGYNQDCYYWEIVLFARKFLLIFIGVFTEFFPKSTRDINLVWILILFFLAQIKFKPFQIAFFNNLETLSLTIATVTCYIGILLYSNPMKEASLFFMIVVFLINGFYLGVWGYFMKKYGNVREEIRVKFRWMKEKIVNCCRKMSCNKIIKRFC